MAKRVEVHKTVNPETFVLIVQDVAKPVDLAKTVTNPVDQARLVYLTKDDLTLLGLSFLKVAGVEVCLHGRGSHGQS